MPPLNKILDKVGRHQEDKEVFLALSITDKRVKGCIWTFKDGKGEVLTFGSSESWSGNSVEELIVGADVSIAAAITSMPEVSKLQPNKVVLGVPEHWIEGALIKLEKAKMLQFLCRKLLLTSLGFVVIPEGITYFLKKEEGDLVSVVLVDVGEAEVIVSLIVRGKYLGSQLVGRSSNLASDLEEGLLRFNFSEILPPRILLLGYHDLEKAKQSLVAYPWVNPEKQKPLSFLQLPRVDIANDNMEMSSVVLAGSYELKPKENPAKEEETTKKITEEPEILLSENFDFVKNRDIALEINTEIEEPAVERDEETFSPPVLKNFPDLEPSKFREFFSGVKIFFRFFSLPDFGFLKKRFLPLLVGVFLIFALAGFAYYKLVKAEVVLRVEPLVIQKEIDFSVLANASSVDLEKMILPATEITADVAGVKEAAVRGRKTVGDKATGEIILYNKTEKAKTLDKGTSIKGANNSKFLLNQEAVVPAMVEDLSFGGFKWGEKKVSVTAADIGTQYNLAANSILSLESGNASSSSVIVKNPDAFSGGTSREILAVSKEDREDLQKTLALELLSTAENDIKNKVASSGYVLGASISLKNKTDRFDREVGDEAENLSLEENGTYTAYYFRNEDGQILIDKVFSPLVPDGFDKNPVVEEKEVILKDKSKNEYRLNVVRHYYPLVPTLEISKQLKAKTFAKGKTVLSSISGVVNYEILISPKPFSRLQFFPLNKDNIKVTVSPLN